MDSRTLEIGCCVLRASSFHKSLWKYGILTSEFSNQGKPTASQDSISRDFEDSYRVMTQHHSFSTILISTSQHFHNVKACCIPCLHATIGTADETRVSIDHLSCWKIPGRGADGVRGVLIATSFLIRVGFFRAHVKPYDPTIKPWKRIPRVGIKGDFK